MSKLVAQVLKIFVRSMVIFMKLIERHVQLWGCSPMIVNSLMLSMG